MQGRGTRGRPLVPKEDYLIVYIYRKSAGNPGLTRMWINIFDNNPSYILNEHNICTENYKYSCTINPHILCIETIYHYDSQANYQLSFALAITSLAITLYYLE